ncbi:hypothetical protein DFH08DRAFT_819193 [Mycena albidolilacea]|uniref:Zn(2)-C6 fungal-type domain-containing protein n=1 Tax=Mycena albidolilacea TaxID=1033008 RepID=A0AAD6ZFT9_9AGAR|nr:hypothetical protein DFH08DRAFT_819193 [Mycena albidolilacea]
MAIASGKNAEFQQEISRLASWEASDGSGTTRTERNTMSVTWLIGPCAVLILAQTFIPGPWDVVQDFYSSLADAAPPKGPRNDLGIPVDHLDLYEPWPARDRDHSTHSHPQNQASESSTYIWGTSSMSSHSTDSFDVYGSQSFQHGDTQSTLPASHKSQNPATPSPPPASWAGAHPRLPPSSRGAGQSTGSPSQPQLFSSMGCFPIMSELRHWPQVFNNEISPAPKRPTLACLFCRERKIGCMRPSKDNPDQSCNQCVRRKRVCEYPTECRRGQHVRRRRSTKSNPPTLISPASPAAVQT